MASGWSTAAVQARLQATINLMEAGATGPKVLIYTAARPAEGAAITTQTLLATITFATSIFDSWGTDEAILIDPANVVCVGAGSANWARLVDSDNNFICDMDCGLVGSGAEIEFDDLTVYVGGTLQTASAKLREV
jgi:hypothetical protein